MSTGLTIGLACNYSKPADEIISKILYYYTGRLRPARAVQIVAGPKRNVTKGDVSVFDSLTYFDGKFFNSYNAR